jgi:hypothetical protein
MPTIRYFELWSNKKSVAKRKLRHKRGTICYLCLHRMAYQKVGMKVVPTVVPKGSSKGIHYGTLTKQKEYRIQSLSLRLRVFCAP